MARALICVLTPTGSTHGAIVDLDRLPQGAHRELVLPPHDHLESIGKWLQRDLSRAASLMDRIDAGQLDAEAINFITQLASLVENMPPAAKELDLLLAASLRFADATRLAPEQAKKRWESMTGGTGPSTPTNPFLET